MGKLFIKPLLFIFICATSVYGQVNNKIAIIPEPQQLIQKPGQFTLSATTSIYVPKNNTELKRLAGVLADDIKKRCRFTLPILTGAPKKDNSIVIGTGKVSDKLGTEGYMLTISNRSVNLLAPQNAGIFYGIQTINKLLPAVPVNNADVKIPCADIVDYPRFGWRGLMLDVGRYFYPVDFIKKYIDYMAQNKLNTFHWHLVEDGGWRIEIKKYPKLTTIGSKRENTQTQRKPARFDNQSHEGFYTQDEIRDVVAYAKARYVTIVPEIEMPGHTMSSLAAYPELSCTGGPFTVPYAWQIRPDIYCAGNEKTFQFLEDVLSEVVDLFPGQFIHIGGDEAPERPLEGLP